MVVVLEMKDKVVYELPLSDIVYMSIKKAVDEPGCGFPDNTRIMKLQLKNGVTKYIKAERLLIRYQ